MLQELIYTSAPVGLKPGSQGFCTVACTTGMPPNLAKLLETLSGYRHVFFPPDPNANNNPVSCSHLLLNLGGVPWHILSRTADAGLDYTKRTNKISHHIVLDKSELQNCGPAAVLSQYPFQTSWNQKPAILPANKKLPPMQVQPRVCEQWRCATGDAGWGGILAETALTKRPVSLIFRPGIDMLPLIDEAMALLSPEQRWQVSFSTYCCNLPNGTGCQWKCILAGSPEMAQARLTTNTLVIDLTQSLGEPPTGQLVETARTGKRTQSQDAIIPLATQEEAVYGIKGAGSPPVGTSANQSPVAVPNAPTDSGKKGQSGGNRKKKGNDDPSSKGCFWLIILFFIMATAAMIGGIAWLSGAVTLKKGDVTVLEKTIENQKKEIDQLQKQIETEKQQQNQKADEYEQWQNNKQSYDDKLKAKDLYIDKVADYFSLFPPMWLPSESVNLKDGIPRKTGDSDPLKELIVFGGTVDEKWPFKNMLTVDAVASDADLECVVAAPVAYPGRNIILGYPCQVLAKTGENSREPIMEFELVVTTQGISVRHFNDDNWSKHVVDLLAKAYADAKENQENGFNMSASYVTWYEEEVKDKSFVLDEEMLKKLDELESNVFSDDAALGLIDLRKHYFAGELSLTFDMQLDLKPLSDKVKRERTE